MFLDEARAIGWLRIQLTEQEQAAVNAERDPEVAAAFKKSEDVNAVLRALLQTMPGFAEGKSEVA